MMSPAVNSVQEWKLNMDNEKKNQLAAYLFKVFNSENIIPAEVTASLFKMMPSFDPVFTS